jgi:bifunctional N-acetylglucosamine-1-phosphate-uridyltransferase/glucosamine-1-phosphate-acetyltransferase GlmU-like protein
MTRTRTLAAVILVAGKGTRLLSARPKVLHPICGRPALGHVVQTGERTRLSALHREEVDSGANIRTAKARR